MPNPLMAALCQRRDLKQSVLATARNLAARASLYGCVPPTAYRFLAWQGHCSPRTAMRHVQLLEQLQILEPIRQKRIVRRKDLPPSDRGYTDDPRRAHERVIRHEINRYRFTIPWDTAPQRSRSSSRPCDTTAQNLPPTEKEKTATRRDEGGNPREKTRSLRDELANQQRMLHWLYTPGSDQYVRTCEEIARLEALLPRKE